MTKVALIFLFLGISFLSVAQLADNSSFSSAEERIVYNKENQLDKYEGILVEYEYKLVLIVEKSKEEWFLLCKKYFEGLIGVDVFESEGCNYFSVLTEGSRINHDSSFSLPVDLGYKIEFSKRRYHLK